jgi:hypothetical protein
LHAAVTVPARDRRRLERLCRYVARPAILSERLTRLDDGQLVYRLKHRWRDGTTALVFEPEEFVARLTALVPPPLAPPHRAAARLFDPARTGLTTERTPQAGKGVPALRRCLRSLARERSARAAVRPILATRLSVAGQRSPTSPSVLP